MTIAAQSQENGSKGSHTVQIDRRRHTAITGVSDVCSFHETEIVLKIDGGLMVLSGQGLHIARLLLEEGRLDVEGHVDGVNYETPKKAMRMAWPWGGTKKK